VSELWPRLALPPGELDYLVGQYDAQWFLDMAKRIESGQSLAAAAWCFLHLAKTPAAIKAMNHFRPLVPREILGLNRAAHYVARLELRGEEQKKEARHAVAMEWRTADATIRDDVADFGKRAQALIERLVLHSNDGDRRAFLQTFDADMVDRAVRMSKSPKKAPRKPRMRKK
jgi:hypothetical protein